MATIYDCPTEIIYTIFSYCSWMEDFMSFLRVNSTWRELTQRRLKWAKHLVPENRLRNLQLPFNSTTIYYNPKRMSNTKLIAMVELLRNLETVMISPDPSPHQIADLLNILVKSRPFIKRLSIPYLPRGSRVLPFKRLQSLALPCFFRWFGGVVTWCQQNGEFVRELHIKSIYGRQYELLFPSFVNLKRLHVEECGGIDNFLERFPSIDIKTLEMEVPAESYINDLLVKFPNLKNMYLYIRKDKNFADRFPTYPSLENLVMDFEPVSRAACDRAYRIRSIISSIDLVFPNLRTLAIRNHRYINPNDLFALPANLPHLVVLDVVGCWNIDDNCMETAKVVWQAAGRKIELHHGAWHESGYSPVGNDFMVDWFLRDFKNLPYFMEINI